MLGGLALKWRWRARRAAAGKPTDRPNFICGPVQICWHKFARYFDVEMRQVPLSDSSLGLEPDQLTAYCDENTIGVVATFGITFTGVYEPVADLARALDELQEKTGLDIPIHVDAASGGFIAPFIQEENVWDFRIPRVRSINASGHKYGLAPVGVGWNVWKETQDLPEDLIFWVDYLGGNMPTFALNFSRPAGQIIAQYYLLLRNGREGYREIQQACADSAQYLADQLPKLGPFQVLYDGRGGLPAVCHTMANGSAPFTLYDLSDQLRLRGWQVPSYPLPANRQETVVQRILIRHGVSRDMVELLLNDVEASVRRLSGRSAAVSQPAFHHT